MITPTKSDRHIKLQSIAEKTFRNIKSIVSPAFPHEVIYFNSKGLNHFFYTGAMKARPLDEVEVRIGLIDRAIRLLKIMPTPQETEKAKNTSGAFILLGENQSSENGLTQNLT